MKPAAKPRAPVLTDLGGRDADRWRERSGRLFAEFERPSKAMIRRAFRGAFSDDELDDIYANAWLGTLRALAARESTLDDEEIRSYVFTAVANQAGKELRRRKRKPTAPLELVASVPANADTPEERATSAEQAQITRDLLASMPPRRRAVMLLRYGWGLEPKQVCALIAGLSPRAYRKEITRGVDELTEKLRSVERGEWCGEREPLLKAFVAGLAGEDEVRQARAHLAHCRHCADFVARLSGHLHDLGSSAAAAGAIDGLDGHVAIADRLGDLGDRAASVFGRGGAAAGDGATQVATSGGARGAGAAGAGLLAKVAGVGATAKLAIACVGGGVAVTACVAAGIGPLSPGLAGDRDAAPRPTREARHDPRPAKAIPVGVDTETLPSQVGNEFIPPPPTASAGDEVEADPTPADEAPAEPVVEEPTVAATATPQEQEFGVAAAAAPVPPTSGSSSSGGGGAAPATGSPEAAAVRQEFGP